MPATAPNTHGGSKTGKGNGSKSEKKDGSKALDNYLHTSQNVGERLAFREKVRSTEESHNKMIGEIVKFKRDFEREG